MTPAINAAKKAGISFKIHAYDHDPANAQFGLEAVSALKQNPQQVFKTLVVSLNNNEKKLAVAVLPVAKQLNLKKLANALAVKKIVMAVPSIVEKTTGYIVGGISPLGQKKKLPVVLHNEAQFFKTIFVSAGKRGLEIELSPAELLSITDGIVADIGKE